MKPAKPASQSGIPARAANPVVSSLWRGFFEVKWGVFKAHFLEMLLDSIIVFLAANILLAIFDIPYAIPLSIAVAFIIVESAKRLSVNKIRQAEYYFPRFREKLRTSAEYMRVSDNPVVDELHQEVLSGFKDIDEAEFIDERKVLEKSALIALLCFLTIILAPLSVNTDFVEPAIQQVVFAPKDSAALSGGGGEATQAVGSGGRIAGGKIDKSDDYDIFGAPGIARIGEDELKVFIKPAGDAVNIREVKEVELREFDESYPREIFAVSASSFEENIPKEQQELVKNYFAAIAQG